MVDCGSTTTVAVGDEVVLIGAQGDERDHRRGVGRPARHDRLRDRLRHRPRVPSVVHRAVITDVSGVRVGHWTDDVAPHRVHGRAASPRARSRPARCAAARPATREFDLLAPERSSHAHRRRRAHRRLGVRARRLRRRDAVVRGAGRRLPDRRRAGADRGRRSCCSTSTVGDGRSGPGPTRATPPAWRPTTERVGRRGRRRHRRDGRQVARPRARAGPAGSARRRSDAGDLVVAALVAVNAFGGASGATQRRPTGRRRPARRAVRQHHHRRRRHQRRPRQGRLPASSPRAAHDGLARALRPRPHAVDGDAIVAAAVGGVDAPVDQVRVLAARRGRTRAVGRDACDAGLERARVGVALVRYHRSVPTLAELERIAHDCTALPAGRGRGPRWCSAWAIPTPTSCSWARRPARTRTCRACRSSAGRASCSTGSCSRRWA